MKTETVSKDVEREGKFQPKELPGILVKRSGWVCPMCSRCYSPDHSECVPCNKDPKRNWRLR